ncbi:MAG: hypothetical protein LBK42_14435 [Propionibacteriaceae bacterium]|jgi:hypothetical protein|nr:hypothetical protein [Propionibacteriaceae bacterium]
MTEGWLYNCAGVHITSGLSQKATKGYIGVNTQGELILFNNKGEAFDRAPATEVEAKFSGFTGNTIKMNGHKYHVEFHPLSQNFGAALGGIVGGAIAGALSFTGADDNRSEKQKREQLDEVIKRLQGQV